MLEMLMNPKKAERHPWELFFVGLFYASLSALLVHWVFSQDAVLSKYSGILLVTFTVMFSIPFVYYTIKYEEDKIHVGERTFSILREHERAIMTFLWLFLGYVVAFSFWQVMLSNNLFGAQIETYCLINRPSNINGCITQYMTGAATSSQSRFLTIFSNNLYVLISTLIFSLIFGAGVIFVLAWNATVIAAAIGIFTNSSLASIPYGLLRYMIHGLPEIASYFTVALAGGIVSVAVIKHEFGTPKFWEVLKDSLNLLMISILILVIAAFIEVYVTPYLF